MFLRCCCLLLPIGKAAKQKLAAPYKVEIEMYPSLKVEKESTDSTSCVDPEVSRDEADPNSAGTSVSEFLNWATPKLIKQKLDQQQELVKPVEYLPSKWRDSCFPPLFKGEDVEFFPFCFREAAWTQGQSFRCFRYQDTQGPKGAYAQLLDLCLQWLQPEKHTKEEILELVILEQFLTILPLEIQSWLREIELENCAQAVILAENFLLRQEEAKSQELQARIDAKPKPLRREVEKERERNICFLGGAGPLSGKKRRPSEVPFVKIEGERMEEDPENIEEVDIQAGPCRSKPIVAKKGRFQKVREQIIGEKGCDPGHKMLVSPSRPNQHQYCVPNCGEGFDYKSQMITHQIINTGEESHKCLAQCFDQSQPLRRGQRFHPGELMCQSFSSQESTQCGVTPSTTWGHSGGKIFHQCADCGKCFQYKSQLTRHQRVHTREKPYLCSDCGKSFSQRQHQINHQKLHTGENPHRCSDCGKNFVCVSQLVMHQRSHTGEKPFPCMDCGRCFSRRAHLLRHQKTIHGKEK